MTELKVLLNAALVMTIALGALAAEEVSRHGGQFVELEGHHGVEMVAGPDALVFHLTDDHKPMDLAGVQFKAIVQTDAGTTTLALTIDGSTLKAPLKSPLPAGAKIVLTGKDRHGHALQGRFVKQ